MTARVRLQDLIGTCALLTALVLTPSGTARALEVLGSADPKPLLFADYAGDLTTVAASMGRVVFENASTEEDGRLEQTVVTATLIEPNLLLTTAHAFYDTSEANSAGRGDWPRMQMRPVCQIERETREFRWITCRNMRFLPAFAPDASETGERAVSHCLHFAAYPGADGLAQEAVCVLSRSAALFQVALPILGSDQRLDAEKPVLVPFMTKRKPKAREERWDAVVGNDCAVVIDRSLLRPGVFAGPSGPALRHYCAIWAGGSGAPLLQQISAKPGFRIIGIHLGERFNPKDIVRQRGSRRFVAPHRFKGRNANVAVSTKRLQELLDRL